MTTNATVGDVLAGRDWFRIQHDETSRSAVVHIYGTIGNSEWWDDVASPSLVRELDQIDVDEISLYVNSPGGIADDGIAIMNALARNKATVTAYIDGLAASAATIVILGADEIVAGAGSRLMIHDAWSITWGSAAQVSKTAERLDKLSQTLAELYAQRAGGDADEWRTAMLAETWYTAEEAVAAGLVNRVAPLGTAADDDSDAPMNVIPIADAARAFGWRHQGREAASAPFIPSRVDRDTQTPVSTEPGEPIRKENAVAYSDLTAGLRERLGVTDADASDETLLAALDETLNERAEAPAASAASLPEGAVVMDAAALEELRANAALGAQARREQESDRRDAIVERAVNEGRIAPSAQANWRAQLDKDEEGITSLLNSFAANTVPVAEVGHSDTVSSADDSLYAQAWGTSEEVA